MGRDLHVLRGTRGKIDESDRILLIHLVLISAHTIEYI
jgi:hypothetical protein